MATNTPLVTRIGAGQLQDELSESGELEAIAEGIAQVGEAAITEGVDRRVSGLKADLLEAQDDWVTQTLDDLSQEGELASDVVQDVLGAEGVDDATPEPVRAVMERMAKLRVAEAQGALSPTELKMRQEVILRQYMARNPRLTPQFQAAAQDVLGYNPIGAQIDAIVGTIEARQATEDEQLEDFIQISKELGVDQSLRFYDNKRWVANTVARMQQNQQLQTVQGKFQVLDTQKSLDALQVGEGIREAAAGLLHYTQQTVRQRLENILGADPEMWADVASAGVLDEARFNLTQLKSELVAEFKASYPNLKVTGEQLNDALRPMMDYIDFAISEVGTERFAQKLTSYVSMAENGIYHKHPELTHIRAFSRAFEFLPESTLTATAQGREFTQQAARTVSELWGMQYSGRPSLYRPDGVGLTREGRTGNFMWDPSATPEANAKSMKQVMDRSLAAVRTIKKDGLSEEEYYTAVQVPVAALIGGLTSYENFLDETGQVMPPSATRSLFEMSSDETFGQLMLDANPSDRELLNDKMTRAITRERTAILRQAVTDYSKVGYETIRTGRSVPTGQFFGTSFKTPNIQFEGRDAVVQDFLAWEIDGSTGTVEFRLNVEGVDGMDKVSRDTVKRFVDTLNTRSAAPLTKLIRSWAHTAGDDDYATAADIVMRGFAGEADRIMRSVSNGG